MDKTVTNFKMILKEICDMIGWQKYGRIKRVLKRIHKKINRSNFVCLLNREGSRVLEIRNGSLALWIASPFEVTSSRGTSSMLSIEWAGRVKLSETAVGWSTCCCVMAFSICASVLTKSAAKMTFSVGYVLNVAFIALCHINEIRRRAGDVMSYTSLFVGSETSLRHGSLCNERTRFAPFSVRTGKLPEPWRGWGGGRGGGVGACLRCLAFTSMD